MSHVVEVLLVANFIILTKKTIFEIWCYLVVSSTLKSRTALSCPFWEVETVLVITKVELRSKRSSWISSKNTLFPPPTHPGAVLH